jgi:hypothetical protein
MSTSRFAWSLCNVTTHSEPMGIFLVSFLVIVVLSRLQRLNNQTTTLAVGMFTNSHSNIGIIHQFNSRSSQGLYFPWGFNKQGATRFLTFVHTVMNSRICDMGQAVAFWSTQQFLASTQHMELLSQLKEVVARCAKLPLQKSYTPTLHPHSFFCMYENDGITMYLQYT